MTRGSYQDACLPFTMEAGDGEIDLEGRPPFRHELMDYDSNVHIGIYPSPL
jgi:hypothetical protein